MVSKFNVSFRLWASRWSCNISVLTGALLERLKIIALSSAYYRYAFIVWVGILDSLDYFIFFHHKFSNNYLSFKLLLECLNHHHCFLSILFNIIYKSYKLQYIRSLQTNTTAFIKYFLNWQQKAKT